MAEFTDGERRDVNTTSTPRARHKSLDVLFKNPLAGVSVPNPLYDSGTWGEMLWHGQVSSPGYEYWTVPDDVYALYVFGAGGGGEIAASTAVSGNAFGMFRIPVDPGWELQIQVGLNGSLAVGGWPDGGHSGYYVGGQDVRGGGGSTRLTHDGTTLFVAPGLGGNILTPPGFGWNFTRTWHAYGLGPGSFIGASPLVSTPLDGTNFGSPPDWTISGQVTGDAGGDPGGGAGAEYDTALELGAAELFGSIPSGGGGGGGWGGGAGGPCGLVRNVADPDLYRRVYGSGRAGGPYAISGSTYVGEPFETMLDNTTPPWSAGMTVWNAGSLYVRYEVEA